MSAHRADRAAGDATDVATPLASDVEVDEKQLRLLVGDWRKGRANRPLSRILGDGYVMVFALVMIGAMVVNTLREAQRMAASCGTVGCTSGRSLLPWAALAGVLAMTLAACRIFGPVLASAAEGFWLMDSPIRRSRLLARRLVLAVLVAVAGGLVLGALVAALTGSSLAGVVAWSGACGLAAGGLVAFAAAEQGAERTWTIQVLQAMAGLAGLGTMLAVIATATGHLDYRPGGMLALELPALVAALGLALLVVAGLVARARLGRIRRARLMAGGSMASGLQGAMFGLDLGLMRDILVEREAVERGHVRATRGRGLGASALFWRDVQRAIRFPRPLFLLAVSAVVPYAVSALGLGRLNAAISAIVLMAALVPFFASLRVLSRSRGLARCLPWSTSQLRGAASILPGILAGVWSLTVLPAFLGAGTQDPAPMAQTSLVALVCGVAGFVAAFRWVAAKPPDYSGPMVSTSAGAMPPGLAMNLVRGFDMVALITLPVVLGLSPWISLVIAALAWSVLRMGGLDAEEIAAQKEEQERMLAEAKKGGASRR